MTSKESIKSIAFSMRYRMKPKYVYESEQQNFDKIEKDLEVLEIIKKYCDIELFYVFAFNEYRLSFTEKTKTKDTFDTPISREDAEKIIKYFDYLKVQDSITGKVKEVLDNDSRRTKN